MKRFKDTTKEIYEMSKQEKLAHDTALISEAGEDICAVPLQSLRSKVLRDRHKKMCKGASHWSTTNKKSPKNTAIQRAAKRAGMTTANRSKLFNDLDEADIQNLIVLIKDIAQDMVDALKKNDQRKLNGLYQNLGKVIK